MSACKKFCLSPDEPLVDGIRRVVREEIDAAVAGLREGADTRRAVHETRKAIKKIRAVLRLVRSAFSKTQLRTEDHRFRDAGRELAALRDAHVQLRAVEKLPAKNGVKKFPSTHAHFAAAAVELYEK